MTDQSQNQGIELKRGTGLSNSKTKGLRLKELSTSAPQYKPHSSFLCSYTLVHWVGLSSTNFFLILPPIGPNVLKVSSLKNLFFTKLSGSAERASFTSALGQPNSSAEHFIILANTESAFLWCSALLKLVGEQGAESALSSSEWLPVPWFSSSSFR